MTEVLYVTPDPDAPARLSRLLAPVLREGLAVQWAATADEAHRRLAVSQPDVLLVDLGAPAMSDADRQTLNGLIHDQRSGVPTLVLAEPMHETRVLEALDSGAIGCLLSREPDRVSLLRALRPFLSPISVWPETAPAPDRASTEDDRRRTNEPEYDGIWSVLHDGLTGLPNGWLLRDRLSQALARLERHDEIVAVIHVALEPAPAAPHAALRPWDETLREAARRLADAVRTTDTVSRTGEGEFVVACSHAAGPAEVEALAGRLLDALLTRETGEPLDVIVAAGIATASSARQPAVELLGRAEAALHRALVLGNRRVQVFDETCGSGVTESSRSLLRTLRREQIQVEFQPAWSLRDGSLHCIEALVRWDHPERGRLAPAEFLPAAEASGAIESIGLWVLEAACEQYVRWRPGFAGPRRPTLHVNLSPRQLGSSPLVHDVRRVLDATGMEAADLCFEITEHALQEAGGAAARAVRELRDLGVRLCIDDFGTGHSSIASLERVPVSELKLGRSLVDALEHDRRAPARIAGLVSLGHALDLDVVAEGVEDGERLRHLRALGCDGAQGFYLSRPAEASQLEHVIAQG